MNPGLDPSTSDSPAAQKPQTVCPFCGTVGETAGSACRQCGMENTQATRTATRSKIGPWFVWQARNPSAPGMNFATLLALVERGRITPRTVLRGPTTGQLWRFAARVKGVSREFGVCWHCGNDVQKVARLCHACKRLQHPPTNPDNLLESDLPASPPPPEIRPEPATIAPLMPREGRPLPTEPAPADLLSGSIPVIDAGNKPIPAGLEMRAFSLPEDYTYREPSRGRIGRKLFAAAVIAVLCGIAAGGYSPQFRETVVHHYQNLIARLSPPATTAPAQPAPLSRVATPPRDAVVIAHREPATRPVAAPVAHAPSTAPAPRIVTTAPATAPSSVITLTPSPSTQPGSGAAHVQISASPSFDPQSAERWAWERYKRAAQYEQIQEYAQAAKDYEWIRDLRLPEGVGPTDIQARLDHVKQLLQQKPSDSAR